MMILETLEAAYIAVDTRNRGVKSLYELFKKQLETSGIVKSAPQKELRGKPTEATYHNSIHSIWFDKPTPKPTGWQRLRREQPEQGGDYKYHIMTPSERIRLYWGRGLRSLVGRRYPSDYDYKGVVAITGSENFYFSWTPNGYRVVREYYGRDGTIMHDRQPTPWIGEWGDMIPYQRLLDDPDGIREILEYLIKERPIHINPQSPF